MNHTPKQPLSVLPVGPDHLILFVVGEGILAKKLADWKRDGATVQLELYSDMVQALNEVRWLLQDPEQP